MTNCRNCGAMIPSTIASCPRCGVKNLSVADIESAIYGVADLSKSTCPWCGRPASAQWQVQNGKMKCSCGGYF